MTVEVGLDFEGTNGCCGVTQITNFSHPVDDDEYGCGDNLMASGKTLEEAYKNLFDELMKTDPKAHYEGRVLQIWFYKGRDFEGKDNEHYEAEPFRQLIAGITNVINLGEHRNPNSGNLIQGYQWEFQV